MKKVLFISLIACVCIACKDVQTIDKDNYRLVIQPYGPTLGYSPESGVQIIQKYGKAYKDLDRDGKISVYEDWRKSNEKRAEDLAQRLSIEEIAGLMLYSDHQAVPATSYDISTYGGKPYAESGADPWELTDHQKQFLKDDHLRHMLVTIIESPKVAAKWSNRVQAYVEGLGHGIPANNSSDPRHSSRADGEYNAGGGGKISQWPGTLGLAATFSPELVKRFGEIASTEYRALGFTTALSPQVDLGTEPRWQRYSGTFGEDPDLATDMARAYCDGFQKSDKDKSTYVNAMVKHWPGGGCGEAGRDAHYGFGKYAVYPGGNFELHKKPFVEGAFRLHGESKCVAAVMPYYTVSVGQGDELVGNSYNREIITHQLREQAGFEGVVCTDWMVTDDEHHTGIHYGKPWGVEHLSLGERHYKALMAGVDQFGGNYDKEPVLEAYQMGVNEVGKDSMDRRMRQSAKRLLLNFFRAGIFENPYIDVERTKEIVGCPEFMAEGWDAQLKSVVMLKNHDNVLPVHGKTKVYIPNRTVPEWRDFWRHRHNATTICPIPRTIAERYFECVDTPEEADMAIVFIASPNSGCGYILEEAQEGIGNGYHPISLQYEDYTATLARDTSIAGGDPFEDFTNRCYNGKTCQTVNRNDMVLVRDTKKALGEKPVIVAVNLSKPMIMKEIEPFADALFVTFDVQNQAVLEMISGKAAPTGRLPFQMPANMETVETQQEDTPHDMECYKDEDNNVYDFGFGLKYQQ